VAFLSAESGPAVLQETGRRVCQARGLSLADAGVLWGFQIPQLSNAADLGVLEHGLREHGVEVVFIDPLYLAMLAGQGERGLQASNLFDTGPLLLGFAQACLAAGCTPGLIHHSIKRLADPHAPLELEDLAFSGTQEFARQWLLINRREPFQPDTGSHLLWLGGGGSAGQSGLWAVDVEEGVLADDFTGRRWDVTVRGAGQEREGRADTKKEQETAKKREKEEDEDAKLLNALDRLDPGRQGVSRNRVRDVAGLSGAQTTRAVLRLVESGVVEEVPQLEVTIGSGAKRKVDGLRRRTWGGD
jgi:hypothetical protein